MVTNILSPPNSQRLTLDTQSVIWLREQFGWMGSHSGYDQLCQVMPNLATLNHRSTWRDLKADTPRWRRRFLRRLSKGVNASPFYDIASTTAEAATLWQCFRHKANIVHVTYVENHLGILPQYKQRFSFKVIGTCHQPSSWWRLQHFHPESLSALDALIVLSSSDLDYFQQFLGDNVYFIPHGIDTQFFHPSASFSQTCPPRFIFSGGWLRDLQTLSLVIDEALAKDSALQFDMIVPRSKRNNDYAYRIAKHPQVNWYAGISDSQLRQLYQQARGLLLPLIDCTANNALLEAMACGLPVVTNDVGGIRDYTQPNFATLLAPGDIDGFVNAILELAETPSLKHTKGANARAFAEQNLTWQHIAQQTLELYYRVGHENSLH